MKRILSPGKMNPSSLLWTHWERTLQRNRQRPVLIETDSGASWTAATLNSEALKFADSLSSFKKGERIAFCLSNGTPWVALFLALQKLGLIAVPFDAGMPEEAGLELAKHLQCRTLYFGGKFHLLDDVVGHRGSICCIKITSGTSGGFPNSIPCRSEHLIADGENIIRTMGIRHTDRNLAVIPLGHSYGLGNFVMPLILQGTALVCAKQFVPRQIVDWIEQYRVTVLPTVPAIFRVLATMPVDSKLAPLRLAISAGAPLTAEVAKAFYERYQLKIHNFYGSSETGGICYDRSGAATLSGRSVGKPLAGVAVTVKRSVIRVKSAAVAKRSGLWRVPDHGEWNSKGELVLLGRSGHEINIGGKKVHPSEIEHVLRAVPGISDAIAWSGSVSERVFILAAVETALSLAEVQRALSAKLPEWKHPKHYVLMLKLPRTSRGKIDMAALRKEHEKRLA